MIKFTRPRERGRYISLLMMLESAGAVVGALLGSWLLNFDFEYVCLLGAGLFVCAALCNLLILPPTSSPCARRRSGQAWVRCWRTRRSAGWC